jgi:hypothetical protein
MSLKKDHLEVTVALDELVRISYLVDHDDTDTELIRSMAKKAQKTSGRMHDRLIVVDSILRDVLGESYERAPYDSDLGKVRTILRGEGQSDRISWKFH